MIIINLKNYKIGKDVLNLVRQIEIYYNKAIVAVPFLELGEVVKNTSLTVYSQHVDYHEQGKSTGYIIPESLAAIGISGTLLNHSEHKLKLSEIKNTIKRCNEVGMKVVVCVSNVKEAEKVKKMNPYAIAFEDKKLISTGKSITEYGEKELKKFIESMRDSESLPLCGAGITKGEDVAKAMLLGCKGILVSSAIANSQNPEKLLKEIASIF